MLDLASDVGGIGRVLVYGSSCLLALLNYDYLDNYLTSRLFKIKTYQKPTEASKSKTKRTTGQTISLEPSKWCGVGYLCSSLCGKLCGSRGTKKKKARALELIRKTLAQETDIVAQVRKQRLFMKALNCLMTREEISELEKLS